ncbi:UDP-3-O-(3-hydroxymyristoyl)glucosamine N-acyltransferase [Runella limosa]|uniref:UDP-3-O-(3-hydroxymyristoyl)glucosamine N-acyltransferase n=1 Tax=Runella limosa TaxID=370978 RepID=UPI00042A01F5|nr:UDP-3-O-(3-hydroxymyristoyl)glucosamine N-acyltransferase [Runella limosa]MCA0234406.1 UDP-3-O-(3-hydroxymyristoyl)glucosamine N-acyltransferase [Bacteroidota bacterium]
MEFTVKQIAGLLGGEIEGEENLKISQLSKIEEGISGSISFLSNPKYEPYLYTTEASAVIVDKSFEPKKAFKTTLIRVESSYTAFTQLLQQYERIIKGDKRGIEQPSYLGEGTELGENPYLGAFAYVGTNCKIGKNVKIYPHAYVGDNVKIGDGTVIHSGVRIYNNTIIGQNCTFFANAVIGSDGFGFAPLPDGTYKTIPQLGNVVIEDNVSIGAGATIDCATMGSTVIRQGVKLDNLVQVGHNVEIGKNTVIAAQAGIAGSTKIGENCVIGGQAGFNGHITVPKGTKVGGQAGVTRTWEEEGLSLNGTPALELKDSLRSAAIFRKLPLLEKRVHELEKQNKEDKH